MTDLEDDRLLQAELDALELDTFAKTAFDDLTRAAAETFETPIATLTIVDGAWRWFNAKFGLQQDWALRARAFSDHAIRSGESFFVVEDAGKDPRFADHPLVTGEPHVRFYAAAPLRLSSGHAIGTLDVMDGRPRAVDSAKLERLKFMADQVMTTLEARKATKSSARGPT